MNWYARTSVRYAARARACSRTAPHLFGDTLASFETELRHLLHNASLSGMFSEHTHETAIDIWRR
ncbi:hypothetical protein ACIA8C_20770 [Nocardia sp. NPDC051321]|uniref:hypothetical protein n=1 Tax=Nocardia sp. NPDC051321 TaxID=3364323 RepID=UPI003791A40F